MDNSTISNDINPSSKPLGGKGDCIDGILGKERKKRSADRDFILSLLKDKGEE